MPVHSAFLWAGLCVCVCVCDPLHRQLPMPICGILYMHTAYSAQTVWSEWHCSHLLLASAVQGICGMLLYPSAQQLWMINMVCQRGKRSSPRVHFFSWRNHQILLQTCHSMTDQSLNRSLNTEKFSASEPFLDSTLMLADFSRVPAAGQKSPMELAACG